MELGCFTSPGTLFMQLLSALVSGFRDTKHVSLAIELYSPNKLHLPQLFPLYHQ